MQIEPFYFGANRELHGIYHSPHVATADRAVLMVPPLLNDAVRSHSAFRRIAISLAESGVPVLRFDFRGTGNSGGEVGEVSLADWIEDIQTASRELTDISGGTSISIITARFSASVVAAASQQIDIDRVTLWDPIFSGSDWMELMREIREGNRSKILSGNDITDRECMGHLLSQDLIDDLLLQKSACIRCRSRTHVISSVQHLSADGGAENIAEIEVNELCNWNSTSSQRILPHSVIDQICRSQT